MKPFDLVYTESLRGDLGCKSFLRWATKARRFVVNGGKRRPLVGFKADLFAKLDAEDLEAAFGVMAACPEVDFATVTERADLMLRWFEDQRAMGEKLAECVPGSRPADDWIVGEMIGRAEDRSGRKLAGSVAEPLGIPWPLPNVWPGVSVEDQPTADARIPHLLDCPATVRFASYEPALGPASFRRWLRPSVRAGSCCDIDGQFWHEPGACSGCSPGLNLIIVGGESGPGARPFEVAWARSTIEQCREAGVACWVAQLGSNVEIDLSRYEDHAKCWAYNLSSSGANPAEWPEDLRVRQMPGDGG